jgi:hypothetical protein
MEHSKILRMCIRVLVRKNCYRRPKIYKDVHHSYTVRLISVT